MNFAKSFKPKELVGSCAQICLVAALLPFLAIIFGIIFRSNGMVADDMGNYLISLLPYSDEIQAVLLGAELGNTKVTVMSFLNATLEALEQNGVLAIYVGMWMHAFKIIFKEILPLRGIPLIQTVLGLFFGALSLNMFHDPNPMLVAMVTMFIFALNIVLTIIFVPKGVALKVWDIILMSLEAILTPVVSGYVVVLVLAYKGGFADVKTAVVMILLVTLIMILYSLTQYLVFIHKK